MPKKSLIWKIRFWWNTGIWPSVEHNELIHRIGGDL